MIGAGGGLKLDQRGTLRYPMESDRHGIFKYTEKDSIKNKNCPYILIAIGRASFEIGAALYMPGCGGDGTIAFTRRRHRHRLQPQGARAAAARATRYHRRHRPALTSRRREQRHSEPEGDFVFYIGSRPAHENDVAATHPSSAWRRSSCSSTSRSAASITTSPSARPSPPCSSAPSCVDAAEPSSPSAASRGRPRRSCPSPTARLARRSAASPTPSRASCAPTARCLSR